MTTAMSEPSTRRVLWWARSFGRPLQDEFGADQGETPDELDELLAMADKRLGDTANKKDEK